MTALSRVGDVCGLNKGGEDRSVKVVGKEMCSRQGQEPQPVKHIAAGVEVKGLVGKRQWSAPQRPPGNGHQWSCDESCNGSLSWSVEPTHAFMKLDEGA